MDHEHEQGDHANAQFEGDGSKGRDGTQLACKQAVRGNGSLECRGVCHLDEPEQEHAKAESGGREPQDVPKPRQIACGRASRLQGG